MSWPLVELGTVAVVSWGNTSITKESYRSSGFPAFSAAGEDGFLEIHENDCDGIVLSAIGARCGRCFKASGKWTAIKNTITILEREQGVVCLQYLFHFLSRANVWPNRGGAQPFIALGDARKVKVPLPPLPEQKRIAAILDKADAIRRKRQQAIQLADDFLRAVFLDMFGDPVSNPKGWPKKSLRLLGKSATGRTPPGEKGGMWGEGLPFVTPGDLCGQVDSTVREVTREGAKYSKICRKGSLLVCCIGTVGKVGIAGRSLAFNQQINAQEWGSEIADVYGFFVFKLSPGLVSSKAIQTTLPILKKSLFDEIEIPVPPRGLQEKFSTIAQKISESSLRHESGLNTPLFESLSQLAFSGQL